MPADRDPGFTVYRCGYNGFAYNEAAFRHLLTIERLRARRSVRRLLLVLVTSRQPLRSGSRLTRRITSAVFEALGQSVREVDFVGWYREGAVPGAVLALKHGSAAYVRQQVLDRVTHLLGVRLPAQEATQLRVRVRSIGADTES
jgi:hypothetical protein